MTRRAAMLQTEQAIYDGQRMVGRLEPAPDGIRCFVVNGPEDDGCMIGTVSTAQEARQLIRDARAKGGRHD